MRDITLTVLERECWRLRGAGADYRQIGERIGCSGRRVQCEVYNAAAKLIRRWQKRLPRPALRKVLRRGK